MNNTHKLEEVPWLNHNAQILFIERLHMCGFISYQYREGLLPQQAVVYVLLKKFLVY